MKITRIDATAWDVPMRAPYRSAQRITTTARNVLVAVSLEDGTKGFGESAPATYVTGETQESVLERIRGIAGVLLGTGARAAYETVGSRLLNSPGAAGALEMALADALARAAGLPLYRWLSGKGTDAPERVTDLSLPILTPEEAGARAALAAAGGFKIFKIKVGSGDRAADTARVRAVAAAAPGSMLRLDGNQGFEPQEAVWFLNELEDLFPRIELFEQPTSAGNDDALTFVHLSIPDTIPVFADESVHTPEDARRLIENGACGGVVLKLAKSGLTRTAQIAQAAHAAGGRCLFGCMMETRIAISAALHLAVALGIDTVPLFDLDGHLLVNDEALVKGGLTQSSDRLCLDAAAPGLDVTLLSP